MLDWNKIDNIEKETPSIEFNPNERRIAPSVQKALDDFDKLASEGTPTDVTFHQSHEETVDIRKYSYLQKALAQTLRWQSFCQTSA